MFAAIPLLPLIALSVSAADAPQKPPSTKPTLEAYA